MRANPTPGPWQYGFESVDPEWAIVTTSGGSIVANVNAGHRQEANARLIAAAPDLYEALRGIIKIARAASMMHNVSLISRNRIAKAEAALAKAEGNANA